MGNLPGIFRKHRDDMQHDPKSPSKSKRFLACAGALPFANAVPEELRDPVNQAALMGTATHALIERVLKNDEQAADYKGRIIEILGEEQEASVLRDGAKMPKDEDPRRNRCFDVDDYMIDGANTAIYYVRERIAELKLMKSEVSLERRTNPLPDRDDTSGTADITLDSWPRLLEVVDFKNGYILVDHKNNPQLTAYLLGRALEVGLDYLNYRITVIQPNADHEEGRIRSFDYTAEELLAFQAEYRAGVERVDVAADAFKKAERGSDKAKADWTKKNLVAGDHCTFCEAITMCPAHKQLAAMNAQIDFDAVKLPAELPFCADDEFVAKVLKWAPRLESLIKKARSHAYRSLSLGCGVEGFKLVEGRSNRKFIFVPEEELVELIVDGGFLKKSQLYTKPELISGPAAEKLVDRSKRKEFEKEFLHKPAGNLIVVAEDDPREAIQGGFDAIEEHDDL